jgi:chemotaxis protein MotB
VAKDSNHRIVIVRRRRHGAPHHGGAWKVAYADFVTAMMAFFLLLWLLNVTTDDQKLGIAHYFAPENVSTSTSGMGRVLSGLSALSDGAMPQNGGGPVLGLPVVAGGSADEDTPDRTPAPPPVSHPQPDAITSARVASNVELAGLSRAALSKALAARDAAAFSRVEAALRQALRDIPELRPLRDNLLIDRTPDGLRIQIVDQEHHEMFPTGSAVPNAELMRLVALVAPAIARLPNPIDVIGHTDSLPYPPRASHTNWELSIDRANACRRALVAAGLPPDHVETVLGKADSEPLFVANPADARNRRIAIVLLSGMRVTGANAMAGHGRA